MGVSMRIKTWNLILAVGANLRQELQHKICNANMWIDRLLIGVLINIQQVSVPFFDYFKINKKRKGSLILFLKLQKSGIGLITLP